MRRANFEDFSAVVELATATRTYIPNVTDEIYLIDIYQEIIAYIAWQKIFEEASLLGIAVKDSHRRRGFARRLIQETLPKSLCFLEVREHNFAAQNLYRSFGFEIVGQRKNYYSNPPDNAILMRLDNRINEKI